MSKNLAIIVLVVVSLLAGTGFFLVRGRGGAGKVTPTPTPEKMAVEAPIEERPYVSLIPRADGRELTLSIAGIKNATSLEYELAYLSRG